MKERRRSIGSGNKAGEMEGNIREGGGAVRRRMGCSRPADDSGTYSAGRAWSLCHRAWDLALEDHCKGGATVDG